MGRKFDFSGWATKNNLRCSDGRTIRKDAFKGNDGQTVPLVWQHQHDDPTNVLGHALLENREEGVYTYCTFNDTEKGQHAKALVEHGDVVALSIYANQLQQRGVVAPHHKAVPVATGDQAANVIAQVLQAHAATALPAFSPRGLLSLFCIFGRCSLIVHGGLLRHSLRRCCLTVRQDLFDFLRLAELLIFQHLTRRQLIPVARFQRGLGFLLGYIALYCKLRDQKVHIIVRHGFILRSI